MSIAGFSVRRPVTIKMFYLGIVIAGVISLFRLPQELFPSLEYPRLTVVTFYSNASPSDMENLVTRPLEEMLSTLGGLKDISSISREGVSYVLLDFNWGADINFASLEAREKIDLVKERLPQDIKEPLVLKYNPFQKPTMVISVRMAQAGSRSRDYSPLENDTLAVNEESSSLSQAFNELNWLVKQQIKEKIEKVEGVAFCKVEGMQEREIVVEAFQDKLASHNIDLLTLAESLRLSNVSYPAGKIEDSFFEWMIRTEGEFKSLKDIEGMPLFLPPPRVSSLQEDKKKFPSVFFLKDMAGIKDSYKEKMSYSRLNLEENISLIVHRQAQANIIRTSDKIRKLIGELKVNLPPHLKLEITYDQSLFIKEAVRGLVEAAIEGGLLTFLVLFLFLGDVKNSFVVTLSIPLSLVIAFSCMYFGGITLNLVSFGGLVLGVGMMVDCAIVVFENVFRRLNDGCKEDAVGEAVDEVTGAIISSTLTTIAVFLPAVFIGGISGKFFKDLGLTITFSLIGSLFVAVTFIPSIAGSKKTHKRGIVFLEKIWEHCEYLYAELLKLVIKFPVILILSIIILTAVSLFMFKDIHKEFMPKIDKGEIVVNLDMPAGTRLGVTNKKALEIEKIISQIPNVNSVWAQVGSNHDDSLNEISVNNLKAHQASFLIQLKKENGSYSSDNIMSYLKSKLALVDLEGGRVVCFVKKNILEDIYGEAAQPVKVRIKGYEFSTLKDTAQKVKDALKKIDGLVNINDNLEEPAVEEKAVVLKEKAALYSLSAAQIARLGTMALKGGVITEFKQEGKEIDVRLTLSQKDKKGLKDILIYNSQGEGVKLGEVVRFEKSEAPSAIQHFDKERLIEVGAVVEGKHFARVSQLVKEEIEKIPLPSGYSMGIAGETFQMENSFTALRFVLILSLILIYMIMAAQFESLWQPLIIMVTVPFSLIGVIFALYIRGVSLNMISFFGIIMLAGIVVNNGIVLISCVNDLRMKAGLYDAVVNASRLRLRPVLMTTLTTILGLLPLAFDVSKESGMYTPLAVTVMGGLSVSTFLTLAAIPAFYYFTYRALSAKQEKQQL